MLFRILLIIIMTISPVLADGLHSVKFKNIISELPVLNNRICKFSQVKTLPTGITFESSGNFEFNKTSGITFYTMYPVKTTSYPQSYSEVNDIIKAISSKSCGRLEKDFSFYYGRNGEKWALELKPKLKSKVAKFIESIKIEGSKDIDKIFIINADGTKTEITYY